KYNNLKEVDTEGSVNALKSVNGKIKLANGNTPKGAPLNYVLLNENGSMRLVFGEGHSYLSLGKNVEYAGEIKFTNSGNISFLNNRSGHYLPDFNDSEGKNNVLNTMKSRFGIDLDISIFQEYKN
ncbi:hypothetical protein MK079_05345, partial [Candidatus Gracilibacteria bacterium]|nr:hypothetical protein [Candidatus Gracilibacteria bacterium]